MTKVTIENGCTVIRKPFDAEWAKAQLDMGVQVAVEPKDGTEVKYMARYYKDIDKFAGQYFYSYTPEELAHTLTILPPLPRKPTPEDAPLLYRYMAEGLMPEAELSNGDSVNPLSHTYMGHPLYKEITHCLVNGERVEIALTGGDSEN